MVESQPVALALNSVTESPESEPIPCGPSEGW